MKKPKLLQTAFESFSQFEIRGEGGNGVVYAATASDGSKVAIKVLKADRLTSSAMARFKNEIGFCARSISPHVVKIMDHGLYDDGTHKHPFCVMPLYDGTLRTALQSGQRTGERLLRLFSHILEGLRYIHKSECWHRDLKPENTLWLSSSDTVAIGDLGIAHIAADLQSSTVNTRDGERLANHMWPAPEQRNGGKVDARTDLFTLGMILNWMFTDEPPQSSGHRTVAQVNSDYGWVDAVVNRLLKHQPTERLQSVEAVSEHLDAEHRVFAANQRAAMSKAAPVLADDTPLPEDITVAKIVGFDNDQLRVQLSRSPEPGWRVQFRSPDMMYSGLTMAAPHHSEIIDDILICPCEEKYAKEVLGLIKRNLDQASRLHRRQVERDRKAAAETKARALAKKIADDERSARVLRDLAP